LKKYKVTEISKYIRPAIERNKTRCWINWWRKILASEENNHLHDLANKELPKYITKMADSYKGSSEYWNKLKEKYV